MQHKEEIKSKNKLVKQLEEGFQEQIDSEKK